MPDRGIFLSSEECALSEKLSIGEFSEAILKALTEHDTKNPGYENEADCIAAFGRDRCEVRIGGRYRARAQAFLVTLELPADAVSLFAPSPAIVGFQSASGQEIDATDHTLLVSETALALAHENARVTCCDRARWFFRRPRPHRFKNSLSAFTAAIPTDLKISI